MDLNLNRNYKHIILLWHILESLYISLYNHIFLLLKYFLYILHLIKYLMFVKYVLISTLKFPVVKKPVLNPLGFFPDHKVFLKILLEMQNYLVKYELMELYPMEVQNMANLYNYSIRFSYLHHFFVDKTSNLIPFHLMKLILTS